MAKSRAASPKPLGTAEWGGFKGNVYSQYSQRLDYRASRRGSNRGRTPALDARRSLFDGDRVRSRQVPSPGPRT